MIFVLAGNSDESRPYRGRDYRILGSTRAVEGLRIGPDGELLLVGSWAHRRDLREIARMLSISVRRARNSPAPEFVEQVESLRAMTQ